jgi:SNF2 family DNA or RNA helicase
LKDHQLSALQFLKRNESNEDITSQLWSHSNNDWIRDSVEECTELMAGSEYEKPQGSILADDMGLGKTLTALMFILATSQSALLSQRSHLGNSPMMSAATLIVCPLAALLNWENKIQLHFQPQIIPYCVFHGRNRG